MNTNGRALLSTIKRTTHVGDLLLGSDGRLLRRDDVTTQEDEHAAVAFCPFLLAVDPHALCRGEDVGGCRDEKETSADAHGGEG